MKRYLLFAGPHYYPAGGTDDLIEDFDTMELAVKEIRNIRPDWWNILDTKTGQTYDNYNQCALHDEEPKMSNTNEDEPCSWPTGNCSFSEQITQLQVDNQELWREIRVLQDSNNKSMDTITQLNVEWYEMREALRLADAALRGANMNMNVVEKKIRAALKGTRHD